MTSAAGLPAYEISNHARPGHESRHNLTYWRYGDYAGIGPGAHGRRLGMRTVRHRKPENFLSALRRNGHGIAEEARALRRRKRRTRRWSWDCGCSEGVDAGAIAAASASIRSSIGRRSKGSSRQGHLSRGDAEIALTPRGRLLLSVMLVYLVPLAYCWQKFF